MKQNEMIKRNRVTIITKYEFSVTDDCYIIPANRGTKAIEGTAAANQSHLGGFVRMDTVFGSCVVYL